MRQDGKVPVHPGEILLEEFMNPLGISVPALAESLYTPQGQVEDIIAAKSGMTVAAALRLARFFATDMAMWINLQTRYEADSLDGASRNDIRLIVPYEAAAGA